MTETAQTIKEVSQMAGDAITSVMPYLDKLAEKLGQSAQYLWMLQIKQGYILATTMCLKYTILGIVLGLIWYWVLKNKENLLYWDAYCAICSVLCAFTGALILFFMSDIQLILTLIFNTDYWAIQQLILLMKANVQF